MKQLNHVQTRSISGGCGCFTPHVTIKQDGTIRISPHSDTISIGGLVLKSDGIYDVYGNLSTSPNYTGFGSTAQVLDVTNNGAFGTVSNTYTIRLINE